jgi:hypothetical protein
VASVFLDYALMIARGVKTRMYSGVTAWTFILRLLRDPQGQHTFLLFTDLVNEDILPARPAWIP